MQIKSDSKIFILLSKRNCAQTTLSALDSPTNIDIDMYNRTLRNTNYGTITVYTTKTGLNSTKARSV